MRRPVRGRSMLLDRPRRGRCAAHPRPDRSELFKTARRGLTDFLYIVAQGLSGQKRPPSDQSFRGPRQPEFPRERKVTLTQAPSQRDPQRPADAVAQPRDPGSDLPNLVVEQEKLEHPVKSFEILTPQPGQDVLTQGQALPFLERLWFGDAHLPQLRPDGNSGVGSENIG